MRRAWLFILAFGLLEPRADASDEASSKRPERLNLVTRFGRNIADSFTGWHIALHVGSIASTALFAATPVDSKVREFFQRDDPLGTGFGDTAFVVGLFLHVGIGLSVYLAGLAGADERTIGAGAAALIGLGMVSGASHWLSDVVAGAMIGHAIGWSTGRGFRVEYDRRFGDAAPRAAGTSISTKWRVAPLVAPGVFGLSLSLAP